MIYIYSQALQFLYIVHVATTLLDVETKWRLLMNIIIRMRVKSSTNIFSYWLSTSKSRTASFDRIGSTTSQPCNVETPWLFWRCGLVLDALSNGFCLTHVWFNWVTVYWTKKKDVCLIPRALGELVHEDASSMGLGVWGLWKQQKTADSNGFVADEQDKSGGNSKMGSARWRYFSRWLWYAKPSPCDSLMAFYDLVGVVTLETLIPFHRCWWNMMICGNVGYMTVIVRDLIDRTWHARTHRRNNVSC